MRARNLSRPEDRADLLRRLDRLRPDTPRRWGRMDAHQMICHLADAMRAITGLRAVSSKVTFLNRTFIKFMAVHAPIPWPQGYPTRPELDQHQGGTRPSEFAADLQQVEALLDRFREAATSGTILPHPVFGPMTSREWLRWGYLHVDHHLRQFGL